MAITWTHVTNLDASLAAVPAAAQAAIIADVYLTLSASRWGDRYDLAVKYLAAHLGALERRQAASGGTGAVGPVQSMSLGDASVTYAVSASASVSTSGDLDSTPWGQAYKRLRRGLFWGTVV